MCDAAGAGAGSTGATQRTGQLIARLRQLPGVRWVSLTPRLRDRAADLAIAWRLRGADAVYVALADRLRVPLVTWDHEQLIRTQPPDVARAP